MGQWMILLKMKVLGLVVCSIVPPKSKEVDHDW